jgi:hypothetical protein
MFCKLLGKKTHVRQKTKTLSVCKNITTEEGKCFAMQVAIHDPPIH